MENPQEYLALTKDQYPLLIDEFPYCDIKNDSKDLSDLINGDTYTIQEIAKYRSYIWKINFENHEYFVKQFYNRLNMQQLWNHLDSQEVHTIWMQYYTSILSANYPCVLTASLISEKLFSYVLPSFEILPDNIVYHIYPYLLKQLEQCEAGRCPSFTSVDDTEQYFKRLNSTIQYKHKYYTLDIYAYELHFAFENNNLLFSSDEIFIINQLFEKIGICLLAKRELQYGLNYGKSFLGHVVYQTETYLLLPSSDIYIGELGQDEGIMFADYYLQNHSFFKTSYYPRKNVLLWTLLRCIELFISCKILFKPSPLSLNDLNILFAEISTEM